MAKITTNTVARFFEDSKEKAETFSVNKYLTSQTCNKCKEQNLNHLSAAVLKCDSCNSVWNCDVMAAKNIHNILTYMSSNPMQYKNPLIFA